MILIIYHSVVCWFCFCYLHVPSCHLFSDSKIQYQITSGNQGAVFDIDSDTGMVKVKNKLDFETASKVRLDRVRHRCCTPSECSGEQACQLNPQWEVILGLAILHFGWVCTGSSARAQKIDWLAVDLGLSWFILDVAQS